MTFLRFIVQAVGHPANLDTTIAGPEAIDPANFASDGPNAPLGGPLGAESMGESQKQNSVDPFAVPLEEEANYLIWLYFSTVNLMIPCIHETSFRQTYSKLKTDGPRSVRKSWLGVLNMIFAVSTNVTVPTSPAIDRVRRSTAFFERSMELVRADILGRLSVEMGAQ